MARLLSYKRRLFPRWVAAVGRLYLDGVRALVGQQLGAVRAGEGAGKLHHFYVVENTLHVLTRLPIRRRLWDRLVWLGTVGNDPVGCQAVDLFLGQSRQRA